MDNGSGILKPRNQTHNNDNNYARNGKIMLCSVIILFVAVFLMVCFHSYSRFLFKHQGASSNPNSRSRSRRRRHQDYPNHYIFTLSDTATTTDGVANQGLDMSILKSLSTFVYSPKTHDPRLECAVCLSEFQENERGRMLPMCKHAFHIGCIDAWFHSHSNCPLCRVPVQPDNIPEISAETIVSVIEPTRSVTELCEKKEAEMGCLNSSSSSLPASLSSLECQGEPAEVVGIVVEVPAVDQRCRGLVEMGLGMPEPCGFKSPTNRVFALKRIYSA